MWQAYISQIARLAQSHSLRACCLAFWIRVSQVLFDMRSHSLSSHTSQTKDATDSGRTTMVLDCSNFFATAVMMQRRFSLRPHTLMVTGSVICILWPGSVICILWPGSATGSVILGPGIVVGSVVLWLGIAPGSVILKGIVAGSVIL